METLKLIIKYFRQRIICLFRGHVTGFSKSESQIQACFEDRCMRQNRCTRCASPIGVGMREYMESL